MSYNTQKILDAHSLTPEAFAALPEDQQKNLLLEALEAELPLGMAAFTTAVERFCKGERDPQVPSRLIVSEDPNSPTGKQVIRLLFDMPRQVLAQQHGLAIGGYNCCSIVIAETPADLRMSFAEQFLMQSSPDC